MSGFREWRVVSSTAMMVVGLAMICGCGQGPPAPPEQPIASVRVLPVVRQPISVRIPVVGTVVPVDRSNVAAGTPGLVESFDLREGAMVKQGQTVAQLRTVTLQIQIEEAKATLRERQQMLAQLEKGYRPEEITAAEATMRAAEADQILEDANAARIEQLYARPGNAVTEREREETINAAVRARQAFAAAKADFEMKSSGYRHEEIEAARAAAEAQEQVVARLEDDLKKKTIEAPFTGYLVEKHVEVGEWIEAGAPVASLARLDEVEVRVNVEESWIEQIKVGQSVDVSIDALGGRTIPGVVNYIVPRSLWATGSRSFPVIVRMKNTIDEGRPLLKEGMVARIAFRGAQHDALLAHKDAIVRSTGTPTVFIVEHDNRVRAVQVTEGISDGTYIEVVGELNEGDLLVTEGTERLRPYDQVVILDDTPPNAQPIAGPDDKPPADPTNSGG